MEKEETPKIEPTKVESMTEETKKVVEEGKKPGGKRDYFKQKFNIFFGYNGQKFSGSQKNPGVETVEEALEKALSESLKLISK